MLVSHKNIIVAEGSVSQPKMAHDGCESCRFLFSMIDIHGEIEEEVRYSEVWYCSSEQTVISRFGERPDAYTSYPMDLLPLIIKMNETAEFLLAEVVRRI